MSVHGGASSDSTYTAVKLSLNARCRNFAQVAMVGMHVARRALQGTRYRRQPDLTKGMSGQCDAGGDCLG